MGVSLTFSGYPKSATVSYTTAGKKSIHILYSFPRPTPPNGGNDIQNYIFMARLWQIPGPPGQIKHGRLPNCSVSGSFVLVPRIYEGDAPKGQGESEYTENGACYAVYSPRPRFASATPLINEGGKRVCELPDKLQLAEMVHGGNDIWQSSPAGGQKEV